MLDRYGWTENANGTFNLTLFIEHGRITDKPDGPQMLQGLPKLLRFFTAEISRMTATQNLIIAEVEADKKDAIEALARENGLYAAMSADYEKTAWHVLPCPPAHSPWQKQNGIYPDSLQN